MVSLTPEEQELIDKNMEVIRTFEQIIATGRRPDGTPIRICGNGWFDPDNPEHWEKYGHMVGHFSRWAVADDNQA